MNNDSARKPYVRQSERDTILEVARSVFAEKPYEDVTLEEIALRAQVDGSCILEHFSEGKKEILCAILKEVFDEAFALTGGLIREQETPGATFRDLLSDYIERFVQYFLDHPNQARIFERELNRLRCSDEEEVQVFMKDQLEHVVINLAKVLEHASETGQIQQIPFRQTAHVLLISVHNYVVSTYFSSKPFCSQDTQIASEEAAAFLTNFFLDGLGLEAAHKS